MRKVLFISYYYPPSNLTAVNRVYNWVQVLTKNDFKVTVLTRHWNHQIRNINDIETVIKFGESYSTEKNATIIRVDENLTIWGVIKRNRIIKFLKLSKLFALIEIFLGNRINKFFQFNKFTKKATEIISADPDKWIVVISAGPHQLFQVGYALKRKFSELIWIADYRDEWTTRPVKNTRSKILIYLNSGLEKKWLSNVECFTYVNDQYISRIENFINKVGFVIENGFNNPIEYEKVEKDFKTLTFTYLGTLYNHQEVGLTSRLLESFQNTNTNLSIRLNFIGVAFQDNQNERVQREFSWCKDLIITGRLEKIDLALIISRTDIFLMFPIHGMKGVIPTKVFDYLPYFKPILFFPDDEGKISEILKKTGLGITSHDHDSIYNQLEKFILNGKKLEKSSIDISIYSREFYSKKLVNLLLKIQKISVENNSISSSIRASKTEIKQKNQNNFSRILIISQHIFPIQSPRANRTTELIKELARQGHQVVVYAVLGKYDYSEFLLEYPSVVLKKIELNWMYHSYNSDGDGKRYLLDKVLSRTLGPLFLFPDFEFFYKTIKILKIDNHYDALISIAEPHQIHWGIARYRKMNPKKFPKVWIADCGDPFINNNLNDYIKKKYIKYEHEFCQQSDYITIPEPQSALGFQKEYQNKLKIIPQGFAFDLKRNTLQPKNDVITFAYAGTFNKKFRNPKKLLEILSLIDRPFQFHIFSNQTELVKPFKNILGKKLVLRDQIPREELLLELEKMNFLVNLENFNLPSQVPSKLIDYAIAGRPILNLKSENPNKNEIFEFLSENYQAEYKIQNLEKYNISNVVREFMKIINH